MSKMTVEDYGGSYEFAFFGKDHETFMQYEKLHSALFIEGVIEEKYFIKPEDRAKGKTSDYAFKPRNMMLLGNVTDTYVKGFSIQLSTPYALAGIKGEACKDDKEEQGKCSPHNVHVRSGKQMEHRVPFTQVQGRRNCRPAQ
jgi:DNA polymerase-3 subunit alpha